MALLLQQLVQLLSESNIDEAICIDYSMIEFKEEDVGESKVVSEYTNMLRDQATYCQSFLDTHDKQRMNMEKVATMFIEFFENRSKLSELLNKEVDVRNTEGYEVELGTNALLQVFDLYQQQAKDIKESVAAVLIAENALKNSGDTSWETRFSRERINIGFVKFMSGLYKNRATLYKNLEGRSKDKQRFIFVSNLSRLVLDQGEKLFALPEITSKANSTSSIDDLTKSTPLRQQSIDESDVSADFRDERQDIQQLPKRIQNSLPRLPQVNSSLESLIHFITTLLQREANDLQLMSIFEFGNDTMLQEGVERQFDMLSEEYTAISKYGQEADDIKEFLEYLIYDVMSTRRKEMRAHADALQDENKDKIQWYQGVVMKMDAVIFDKLVLNLLDLIAQDFSPGSLDVIDVFLSIYTERKDILRELSFYLIKMRQFKLSRFIMRQAELQDDVVYEMNVLFQTISELSKLPTHMPKVFPDALTCKDSAIDHIYDASYNGSNGGNSDSNLQRDHPQNSLGCNSTNRISTYAASSDIGSEEYKFSDSFSNGMNGSKGSYEYLQQAYRDHSFGNFSREISSGSTRRYKTSCQGSTKYFNEV